MATCKWGLCACAEVKQSETVICANAHMTWAERMDIPADVPCSFVAQSSSEVGTIPRSDTWMAILDEHAALEAAAEEAGL